MRILLLSRFSVGSFRRRGRKSYRLAKRASVEASAVAAWPSGPAGDSIDASSGPCRKLKYAKPTMIIVNKTAESVCLFFILCYSSSNTW